MIPRNDLRPGSPRAGDQEKWAMGDSNNPTETREIPRIIEVGAAKSAADSGEIDFAEAVRAVMALPLTDAEKAEAVRRLLAASDHEGGQS